MKIILRCHLLYDILLLAASGGEPLLLKDSTSPGCCFSWAVGRDVGPNVRQPCSGGPRGGRLSSLSPPCLPLQHSSTADTRHTAGTRSIRNSALSHTDYFNARTSSLFPSCLAGSGTRLSESLLHPRACLPRTLPRRTQ